MNAKYLNMNALSLAAAKAELMSKESLSEQDKKELADINEVLSYRRKANEAQVQTAKEPGFWSATWQTLTAGPKFAVRGVQVARIMCNELDPLIVPTAKAFAGAIETAVLAASAGVKVTQANMLGIKDVNDTKSYSFDEKEEMLIKQWMEE